MNSDLWLLLGVGIWLTLVWIAIQLTSLNRRREEQSGITRDGEYQPRPEPPTTQMLCGYQASRPINPKNAPKGDPLLKERLAGGKGQAVATATEAGPPPPKAPKPPSAESAQWDGVKRHVYPAGGVPEINPEPNQWQRNKDE